jgi:hypothetical protein
MSCSLRYPTLIGAEEFSRTLLIDAIGNSSILLMTRNATMDLKDLNLSLG